MTSESAICRIGDGKGWTFVNGPWTDGEAGELVAPRDELWTTFMEHLAVVTDRAYTDVEATFEFRRDHGTCGIGMIVRAQDAGLPMWPSTSPRHWSGLKMMIRGSFFMTDRHFAYICSTAALNIKDPTGPAKEDSTIIRATFNA